MEQRRKAVKKLVKALSGKKALYIVIALAAIASVLEIVTSIRNGTNTDWPGMAVCWVAVCGWAVCLAEQEKKAKKTAIDRERRITLAQNDAQKKRRIPFDASQIKHESRAAGRLSCF